MAKQMQSVNVLTDNLIHTFNTGFIICKEKSDDANNFTKNFARVLKFEFYLLHVDDCFSQLLN